MNNDDDICYICHKPEDDHEEMDHRFKSIARHRVDFTRSLKFRSQAEDVSSD